MNLYKITFKRTSHSSEEKLGIGGYSTKDAIKSITKIYDKAEILGVDKIS